MAGSNEGLYRQDGAQEKVRQRADNGGEIRCQSNEELRQEAVKESAIINGAVLAKNILMNVGMRPPANWQNAEHGSRARQRELLVTMVRLTLI
jgi:DNA integrity scanning protein DisA with diadenylate cyclase activity